MVDVPSDLRGEELTEEQVRQFNPSLDEQLVFSRESFDALLDGIARMYQHGKPYPENFPFIDRAIDRHDEVGSRDL